MPTAPQSPQGSPGDVLVPFERVAGMVRHLTHDIRNGLNTLDLQSAYLQEMVTDAEVLPEIQRLRGMIKGTAKMLQAFSRSYWVGEPNLVSYEARIFVEDFRARLALLLPEQASKVTWTDDLGDEAISVDLELVFRALSEFFKNAFDFQEKGRSISAKVAAEDGRFVLELCEGKSVLSSPPDTWGCEPFLSTRRGGFGLGLFHARRILAAHRAGVTFTYDAAAGQLTTRVSLPLAPDSR